MGERSSGEPLPPRAFLFGSIWRGTKSTSRTLFATFPIEQIRENARLIGDLAGLLRRHPENKPRVFRTGDGSIDLQATSFDFGLSPEVLEVRIASRRRQTARLAYVSFVLGCVFVVLWMHRALTSRFGGPHIMGALLFVPFCAIFFLVAFRNAHVNWQLRTGHFGSASDYLRSAQRFWPS